MPAQLEAQMRAAEESSRNAERLKTLYDSGVITEEEYNRETGGAPQSAQAASVVAGGSTIAVALIIGVIVLYIIGRS